MDENYKKVILDLEERIEELENKFKGFSLSVMLVLTKLIKESPEIIKLREKIALKLKLVSNDRDFDFEKEKIIQKF